MARTLAALVALWLCLGAIARADCNVHRGEHVVLYSTTDDPSVLMWDSRTRLRLYSAASFDEAQAMLPHAMLVAPGTHADVAACISSYVSSPIFHSPDDAIAVVIWSGPLRGVTRWVLGSDVRPLKAAHR